MIPGTLIEKLQSTQLLVILAGVQFFSKALESKALESIGANASNAT